MKYCYAKIKHEQGEYIVAFWNKKERDTRCLKDDATPISRQKVIDKYGFKELKIAEHECLVVNRQY